MYSLSSYVSLGLFPLSLCVIVCDQQDVLFSSPVISALFAHRGTLIYLSKTRLERLHPISCFKSPVCDSSLVTNYTKVVQYSICFEMCMYEGKI